MIGETLNQIDLKIIYEDNDFIAFHDIHPKAEVHFLIIHNFNRTDIKLWFC